MAYEYEEFKLLPRGKSNNWTQAMKDKVNTPVISFGWVQTAETGTADYVTGSDGQLKTVLEYRDLAKTDLLSTTTFKYEDALFPTKATEKRVV